VGGSQSCQSRDGAVGGRAARSSHFPVRAMPPDGEVLEWSRSERKRAAELCSGARQAMELAQATVALTPRHSQHAQRGCPGG
jgi:hypothetical protein